MREQNSLLSFLTICAAGFMLMAMAGCKSAPEIETLQTRLTIPEQYLSCPSAGNRPTGEQIAESAVARYIAALEARNQCHDLNDQAVRTIVRCFNDPACDEDNLVEYMGLIAPRRNNPEQ